MDKVEGEAPAASETEQTDSGDAQPAPKAKKAAPPAPPAPPVSIDAMRAQGLVHDGTTSLRLPGSHRALPARTLSGAEAARYIPDRKTLDWVLAHGYSIAPAPDKDATS